jgi:hypothetical protein
MPSYAHYSQKSHSPHACSAREYTLSQAQSIGATPPSLGLSNMLDQKVSEPEAGAGHSLEETTSQQTLSPGESCSHA